MENILKRITLILCHIFIFLWSYLILLWFNYNIIIDIVLCYWLIFYWININIYKYKILNIKKSQQEIYKKYSNQIIFFIIILNIVISIINYEIYFFGILWIILLKCEWFKNSILENES